MVVQIILASLNHVLCIVDHPLSQTQMHVLAVYGFSEDQNKCCNRELIRRLKPLNLAPWICLGDSNDLFSSSNKLGSDSMDVTHLHTFC